MTAGEEHRADPFRSPVTSSLYTLAENPTRISKKLLSEPSSDKKPSASDVTAKTGFALQKHALDTTQGRKPGRKGRGCSCNGRGLASHLKPRGPFLGSG